jgi:2-polyprenyl-3-methyl-5-hydroxy-6-metoxy-1,4-benzoquinol methylase
MSPTGVKPSTNFDEYAVNYEELLNQSVSVSGESVEYFASMKANYLQRRLGNCFSGNILDYGCGIGMLSRCVAEAFPGARIDGFDPSDKSISQIPNSTASRGLFTSKRTSLRSDYDLIIIANVMHHVPLDARQQLISGLVPHMSPGGQVVVFEHNPLNPLTRRSVSLCPFDADAVLLWPSELRGYLTQAGLSTTRRDYITFFPRFLKWFRPLEPGLRWCSMGAQYTLTGIMGKR